MANFSAIERVLKAQRERKVRMAATIAQCAAVTAAVPKTCAGCGGELAGLGSEVWITDGKVYHGHCQPRAPRYAGQSYVYGGATEDPVDLAMIREVLSDCAEFLSDLDGELALRCEAALAALKGPQ